MKKMYGISLAVYLCLGIAIVTPAQEKAGAMPPPKVLVINREVLKPGKSGLTHEKSESAFVKAMTAANSPNHYIALDSLTGKSRSLFLAGYSSFGDWEKGQLADMKNANLMAALDGAGVADGELLESYETGVYVLREDQSYNQNGGIAHDRYFDIEVFQIKPGHDADWDTIVKMVKPALAKINPDDHWAMYERAYGGEPAFVVMRPMRSASEIDLGFANDPKFAAAMGEEGMKKLAELSAATIAASETNLFAINPHMSYVGTDMINADPDFWKTTAEQTNGQPANATGKPAQ
ncbi:MAG: hypothetical protein WB630_12650 [Candidatus Acidiferrales bacterium]